MNAKTYKDIGSLKVSEYLAYGGGFIIFLGMVHNIVYYSAFDIRILNYLDFSEIITSFFGIIFVLMSSIAFAIIEHYLLFNEEDIDITDKIEDKIVKEKNIWRILLLYWNHLKAYLFLLAVIIALHLFGKTFFTNYFIEILFLVELSFILILVLLIIKIELERKHIHFRANLNNRLFMTTLLYCFGLTIFVVLFSRHEVRVVKNAKSSFGVIITLDNDKQIISDSTNYFIGKSQNYVFLFHEKFNTTDVFPVVRIKQLSFPKQNKNIFR